LTRRANPAWVLALSAALMSLPELRLALSRWVIVDAVLLMTRMSRRLCAAESEQAGRALLPLNGHVRQPCGRPWMQTSWAWPTSSMPPDKQPAVDLSETPG
jgi:hypothetical protein